MTQMTDISPRMLHAGRRSEKGNSPYLITSSVFLRRLLFGSYQFGMIRIAPKRPQKHAPDLIVFQSCEACQMQTPRNAPIAGTLDLLFHETKEGTRRSGD